MRSVWTVATGRCGTRWLARTLDRVAGVTAEHEPEPVLASLNRRAAEGDSVVDELRALRSIAGDGIYFESGAFLGFLSEAVIEAFPGARLLHVHRDPRAFVASALSTWFPPQEHHSEWWPRSIPDSPPLRMIWWWNAVNAAGLEACRRHGPDVALCAGTEELWKDGIGRVAEWMGVQAPQRPSVPVNSRLGRHVEWDPSWEGFLADHAGEVMDSLGYH